MLALRGLEAEVIVVDNASADGSQEYLSQKFPEVKFLWGKENLGFGKANNQALKITSGDFVLLLNPDTIVAENCFTKCLQYLANHKDCGALGVRMIDGSGKFLKESKRGLPTPAAAFFKMSGLAKLFSRSSLFAKYYAGHLGEHDTNTVDVLAGAFMMLRREAIDKVKGFDEDFFMYGEDVDLSYRICKAGFKNVYFPHSTIIHFKGESTQRLSPEYVRHFYGAMTLFVKKHFSENKFSLKMMQLAIWIRMQLAGIQQRLPHTSPPIKPMSTAVLAGQERFTQMVHLLKYAQPPVLLVGRIAVDPMDEYSAICALSHLSSCIREKQVKQVVLCQGELSFATIIAEVDKVKVPVCFLFHAAGSGSIVGSPQSNSRGIVIAAPGSATSL